MDHLSGHGKQWCGIMGSPGHDNSPERNRLERINVTGNVRFFGTVFNSNKRVYNFLLFIPHYIFGSRLSKNIKGVLTAKRKYSAKYDRFLL